MIVQSRCNTKTVRLFISLAAKRKELSASAITNMNLFILSSCKLWAPAVFNGLALILTTPDHRSFQIFFNFLKISEGVFFFFLIFFRFLTCVHIRPASLYLRSYVCAQLQTNTQDIIWSEMRATETCAVVRLDAGPRQTRRQSGASGVDHGAVHWRFRLTILELLHPKHTHKHKHICVL